MPGPRAAARSGPERRGEPQRSARRTGPELAVLGESCMPGPAAAAAGAAGGDADAAAAAASPPRPHPRGGQRGGSARLPLGRGSRSHAAVPSRHGPLLGVLRLPLRPRDLRAPRSAPRSVTGRRLRASGRALPPPLPPVPIPVSARLRAAAQRRPRAVLMPVLQGKSRPRPAGRMMKRRRGRERKATLPRGSRPGCGGGSRAARRQPRWGGGGREGGTERRSAPPPAGAPSSSPALFLAVRGERGSAGSTRDPPGFGRGGGIAGCLPPSSSFRRSFSGFQRPRGKTRSHRHRHSLWKRRQSSQLYSKVLSVPPLHRKTQHQSIPSPSPPRAPVLVYRSCVGDTGLLLRRILPGHTRTNPFPDALGRKKYS